VDDAVLVGLRDRLARLDDVPDRLIDRQPPLLPEELGEIASFQELHHHVRHARIELPHVRHPRDVRALESRRRPTLTEEPLDRLFALERARAQDLQRHPVAELNVLSGEHLSHAALPDREEHAVLPGEYLAVRQRCGPLSQSGKPPTYNASRRTPPSQEDRPQGRTRRVAR
jgi:hypothetical protein